MRALVLTDSGPQVAERPAPTSDGEACIRVSLAGVCATDLELVKGYMGFTGTLGHEFVGVVDSADDNTWVGRRVVGDINASCGQCATCIAGRPTHCPSRTVLGIDRRDGVFAEFTRLPLVNLHAVPDRVSDEAAVFVEPLAAALEIIEQVPVRPSMRVVVLGTGRLGQLCARVLALTGARVSAVGRNPATLELLPAGIERVPLASASDVAGADLVVDATGNPDGLKLATELVRPRGTVVMKTTVHDLGNNNPTGWVINELTLIGSRCGPFEPALRLLASGAVDPTPLISARFGVGDGLQALEAAAKRENVKVLIEP